MSKTVDGCAVELIGREIVIYHNPMGSNRMTLKKLPNGQALVTIEKYIKPDVSYIVSPIALQEALAIFETLPTFLSAKPPIGSSEDLEE